MLRVFINQTAVICRQRRTSFRSRNEGYPSLVIRPMLLSFSFPVATNRVTLSVADCLSSSIL